MNLVNVPVEQTDIDKHLSVPVEERVRYSIKPEPMPELKWYKISSLGFGSEADIKGNSNSSGEENPDYAASLFAVNGEPFSILCEKNGNDIVYAIGCRDEKLAVRVLKSAFSTVKAEEYKPQISNDRGYYAYSFEPVRIDADEADKRDAMSSLHASEWVDGVVKLLMKARGMVRMDFQPVSSVECEKLMSEAQELCDRITRYLESNVQAGENVADESSGHIGNTIVETLRVNTKYGNSANASVSWKGVSAKFEGIKKEAEYFIKLFDNSKKHGWTVEMTVSAGNDLYPEGSVERNNIEKALSLPVTAALSEAGYTCKWERFEKGILKKREDSAIVLPSAYVSELISFPTTSFYGFERVENCYYNVNLPRVDKGFNFAQLMQYNEAIGVELSLPEREMNRHTFVCGMTGSGKTNTVHHLLSGMGDFPYLVIEPVKGEYHSLPGVKVYTMTAGSSKALCINPFWFPEGSSLQYHIDYLKQIIASAFDLYAAMPNILEQCLVRVYQKCGWDFIQNENRYQNELPEDMLYPTFSDLCIEVENYIDKSDFGEELKGNYRGALLSRLQSFTSGPKGMLLNTSAHLPCEEFSKSKVVISLDSLADDSDKSIVMGIIIAQYYEYLKLQCMDSSKKELQHIVVIEEAHHLFAADSSASVSSGEGGSGQNASQEFVKTLNNMLAEIRAYGEGFIIVDQSPSALHSSVLKNTGIKIAHRIDYGQDIEVMQDVLLLDKEDRELATLEPGQALVHFGGMRSSAKVEVPECKTKRDSVILKRETISGNSVLSTLLEDDEMTKYIEENISDRVIRQFLIDDCDNFKEAYYCLCNGIIRTMIKFGHSELIDKIMEGDILAEYITGLIPKRLEILFPNQYLTNKMICLFIKRCLVLATETDGELRKVESDALRSYRAHRIEPRISSFYEYADVAEYRATIKLIGKCPGLELICKLAEDLVKVKAVSENSKQWTERLMEERYLLCLPKYKELFIANTLGVFSQKSRKEPV